MKTRLKLANQSQERCAPLRNAIVPAWISSNARLQRRWCLRLNMIVPRSLLPSGRITLINLDNWRVDLVEMLDEIGFFDLLEIPRPQTSGKRGDVSVVRFQTGSTFGNNEA
jgi:hypothetical protein